MGYFEDSFNETKLNDLEVDGLKSDDNSIVEAQIRGQLITGTTDSTAGTTSTHAHSLGVTPSVVLITSVNNTGGVVALDGFGSDGATSGHIAVQAGANSQKFAAYVLA